MAGQAIGDPRGNGARRFPLVRSSGAGVRDSRRCVPARHESALKFASNLLKQRRFASVCGGVARRRQPSGNVGRRC
jgi:hypothetical protein